MLSITFAAKTPDFFNQYCLREHYVEIDQYRDAKVKLEEKHVVILTGHPGEGKTTMAAQLANNVSDENSCLILSSPEDWSHVDLELEIFDTIIIDDIFGSGAISQLKVVEEWERRLEEVKRAVKRKDRKLNVIITTRHYILEEAKQTLSKLPMFEDENTVLLSSNTLSEEEKIGMITIKIRKSERDEIDEHKMREYANQSSLFYGLSIANRSVAFGFPECVDMFVRNDSIYSLGAEFFKNPNAFFKEKLEELYRGEKDESKFFALILVWVHGGRLSSQDVALTAPAEKVKEIAKSFGFEWDRKTIRTVHDALLSHRGGYLNHSESSGIYSFSHKVIGDMVGLVTMQDRFVQPAAIKHCPRDFFMEHVTIGESGGSEYTVSIKGPQIQYMVAKAVNLLTRKDGNTNSNEHHSYDQERVISSIGVCSERVEPKNDLDIGVIRHTAFENAGFVKAFMDYVVDNHLTEEVFEVPVLSMSGFFFKYGIKMQKENMCLTAYSVLTKADKLVREVITRKVLSTDNKDRYLYLMFATHNEDVKLMSYLLDNDARVTGDTIYIAVHKANIEILETLLDHPNTKKGDVNDQGNAVNGNYPLIVAARKGLTKAVQCLVDHGVDLAVSNTKKLTALHKAIVYKKEEISEILIENGAPLDKKGGKFKRTPLHIAADMGQESIVKRLLRKGASTLVKDHRGHYPIHLAAIQGHAGAVRIMIQHDKTQEKLKITSYGKKSFIKGLTVYHVAVWKKHRNVLDELIKLGVDPNIGDCYGQTPIFYAIMNKDIATVSKIIESNVADLQKPHKHGYSPLHFAIHTGQTDIAKILCPLVNVNAQDRYKKTPLHVAVEKGNARIVTELIRNYRADYKMVTKRQDTVFHILERKFNKSPNLRTALNKIASEIVDFDPNVKDQLKNAENKYGEVAIVGTINPNEINERHLSTAEFLNIYFPNEFGLRSGSMDIDAQDDDNDDI